MTSRIRKVRAVAGLLLLCLAVLWAGLTVSRRSWVWDAVLIASPWLFLLVVRDLWRSARDIRRRFARKPEAPAADRSA
ncbi:hypothetical protein [Kitasatospora sp. GP82]|uniref:hypothetical protein n=1 Tax=Kitasatospora sp. GP82 TaxID=3035089 RepID=UPI002476447D|nr:hypothetical protein [Kitasatospora sp. GP82]MDH6128997.1 hypothetical protein [Kitasatospora sp. GP82]